MAQLAPLPQTPSSAFIPLCEGAMVGRILDQAKELAAQPADVLKMMEGHLKELSKRVVLWELSVDLEKEWVPERNEGNEG